MVDAPIEHRMFPHVIGAWSKARERRVESALFTLWRADAGEWWLVTGPMGIVFESGGRHMPGDFDDGQLDRLLRAQLKHPERWPGLYEEYRRCKVPVSYPFTNDETQEGA